MTLRKKWQLAESRAAMWETQEKLSQIRIRSLELDLKKAKARAEAYMVTIEALGKLGECVKQAAWAATELR